MKLTDEQLGRIKAAIAEAQTTIAVLVTALRHTFIELGAGDIIATGGDKINGTHYPLDEEQWIEIAETLNKRAVELDHSPLGPANLALDWMNLGPSSEVRA